MKLIKRTSRTFLSASVSVLCLASIGLYFTLRHLIQEEIDDSLRYARASLEQTRPDINIEHGTLLGDVIFFKKTDSLFHQEAFGDTIFFSSIEGEPELFRKYTFPAKIENAIYEVSICRKRIENKDLLLQVGGWTFGFLCALIMILNIVNRRITKRLWTPFYQALQSIRTFSFGKGDVQLQNASDIDEFDELNQALQQMTSKMLQDYRALKQFTENASHEIQTPLAIIQTTTELLAQEIQNPSTLDKLQKLRVAAQRLSGLNQSLLLLTRIENRQFMERELQDLDVILNAKLDALKPVMEGNELHLHTDILPMRVSANPFLLESLLSNLVMNAIRHNVDEGKIEVILTDQMLTVRNTGRPLKKSPSALFDRFSKDEDSGSGTGLGLAIAREICQQHGWNISYRYDASWHEVSVRF